MTLMKKTSERLNKRGQKFIDYYLVWEYNNELYAVRIEPSFGKDYKKLFAMAMQAPTDKSFREMLKDAPLP